jgi:hypothetical protein
MVMSALKADFQPLLATKESTEVQFLLRDFRVDRRNDRALQATGSNRVAGMYFVYDCEARATAGAIASMNIIFTGTLKSYFYGTFSVLSKHFFFYYSVAFSY